MGAVDDTFEALLTDKSTDDSDAKGTRVGTVKRPEERSAVWDACVVGRFDGFDLEDKPLVSGLRQLPGQIIRARTTVSLVREEVGSDVVMLYEHGDPHRPIIIGVLRSRLTASKIPESAQKPVSVRADEDRYVISAEREIVLRCGHSSITLTKAGKVIIKGNYIISRSTGYNKIKGAAVDIN